MIMTEAEVGRLIGSVGPLLMYEFLRTGASVGELRRAISIAGSARGAQRNPSPRIQRLVDLIGAVGQALDTGTAA